MDAVKALIKDKIARSQDPYLKCFTVSPMELEMKCSNREITMACEALKDELGFRFKLDFQPECCVLKACKMAPKNDFQRLYNYARAGISQSY